MKRLCVLAIVVILAACAALVTSLCGCSGAGPVETRPPAGTGVASGVKKDQGFEVIVRSEPEVTGTTGTFSLTLNVRNLSGKARSFALPSGQTYEFIAFASDGHEAWRWSQGMFFTQAVSDVAFNSGDSKVFKVAWNPAGFAPGKYRVEGYFLGLPDLRPWVRVEVKP